MFTPLVNFTSRTSKRLATLRDRSPFGVVYREGCLYASMFNYYGDEETLEKRCKSDGWRAKTLKKSR